MKDEKYFVQTEDLCFEKYQVLNKTFKLDNVGRCPEKTHRDASGTTVNRSNGKSGIEVSKWCVIK